MKTILMLVVAVLCGAGCSGTHTHMLKPLRPYVSQIAADLHNIPDSRKIVLDEIATTIMTQFARGEDAKLTFICSHNSRRSHLSQIWAQTAAYYYGIDHLFAFSGGTEATACNCRTVAAMSRVGFSIKNQTTGDNPIYLVRYAHDRPPVRAYSKLYNADANPKTNFIALMTCSQADKKCPVVHGALARFAIHYMDPKLCDDTPEETVAYDERCKEIAREMFYIVSEVRKRCPKESSPHAS